MVIVFASFSGCVFSVYVVFLSIHSFNKRKKRRRPTSSCTNENTNTKRSLYFFEPPVRVRSSPPVCCTCVSQPRVS